MARHPCNNQTACRRRGTSSPTCKSAWQRSSIDIPTPLALQYIPHPCTQNPNFKAPRPSATLPLHLLLLLRTFSPFASFANSVHSDASPPLAHLLLLHRRQYHLFLTFSCSALSLPAPQPTPPRTRPAANRQSLPRSCVRVFVAAKSVCSCYVSQYAYVCPDVRVCALMCVCVCVCVCVHTYILKHPHEAREKVMPHAKTWNAE